MCSDVHRAVPESSRGLTVFEEDSGGQTALGVSPWSPALLHPDGVRVLTQTRGKEWPKPQEGERLGCSGPRAGWWAACTGAKGDAGSGGVAGKRGLRRARQGRAGWRGRRSGSRWQRGQGHGPGLRRVPAPAPALPLASVPLGGRLASGFRGNAATPALVAPRPAPTTAKGCPSQRSEGTRRTVGGHVGGNRCCLSVTVSPGAHAPHLPVAGSWAPGSEGGSAGPERCRVGVPWVPEGSGHGAPSSSPRGRLVTSDHPARKPRTILQAGFYG